MAKFRLNRNAFKAQTANEAANHGKYYNDLSWQKRMEIAAYLNGVAFDYPLDRPPRLDRTKFSVRSRS